MGGRLARKVAIVTGAGSRGPGVGNGKAAAILFAREGARVLCGDQARWVTGQVLVIDAGLTATAAAGGQAPRRPTPPAQ